MTGFTAVTSVAAPLWMDGIEADQIIPAARCVRPAGADYGDTLFTPWRYLEDGSEDPSFVLNKEPYRRAQILVTGANFGYGSSREHAAWAVRDFGLRAIVATSFASIFRSNCIRNGVLPVVLPPEDVEKIFHDVESEPTELTVSLEEQTVEAPSGIYRFELASLDKELLRVGGDAIGLVLNYASEIDEYRAADRVRRPWVYETVERGAAV
jgi:3-isopropylmalate/(R)-2-methylmalate dehydratase small subunit